MFEKTKKVISIIKGNVKGLLEIKNRGPVYDPYRRMPKMYVVFDGDVRGEVVVFLKERCIFNNPICKENLKIYSNLKELIFMNSFTGARLVDVNNRCFTEGWSDASSDFAYGKPFNSVGGPDSRYRMQVLKKVDDFEAYVVGYQYYVFSIYGKKWREVSV